MESSLATIATIIVDFELVTTIIIVAKFIISLVNLLVFLPLIFTQFSDPQATSLQLA